MSIKSRVAKLENANPKPFVFDPFAFNAGWGTAPPAGPLREAIQEAVWDCLAKEDGKNPNAVLSSESFQEIVRTYPEYGNFIEGIIVLGFLLSWIAEGQA